MIKRTKRMETALTKQIKVATHRYKPQMSSGRVGRTIRWADEVWTPNGIVDSIRFEDCIIDRFEECSLINYQSYEGKCYTHPVGKCKIDGMAYPNKNCQGCFYLQRGIPVIGMLITAYEVKITMQDFKSKNGHNIDDLDSPIANENYYCVPKEMAQKITVPDHCGILAWTGYGLRKYKEAKFVDVKEETKTLLLYNALKKWCDGAVFLSNEF